MKFLVLSSFILVSFSNLAQASCANGTDMCNAEKEKKGWYAVCNNRMDGEFARKGPFKKEAQAKVEVEKLCKENEDIFPVSESDAEPESTSEDMSCANGRDMCKAEKGKRGWFAVCNNRSDGEFERSGPFKTEAQANAAVGKFCEKHEEIF